MAMAELLQRHPLSPPSTIGPYRVADYLAMPDEPRCELLYGRLYVSPAPKVVHQIVSSVLFHALDSAGGSSGGSAGGSAGGLVLFAPVDVLLAEHTVVQPDLCFVSHERRHIVGDRIEGAPDLVVEVLSPGSEFTDRGTKLRLYAENGVREYWWVSSATRSFQFLVSTGDQFVVALAEDDVYASIVIEDLTLDLVAFWEEVDRRIG